MKKILIAFIIFCTALSFTSFVRANDNIEVKVVTDKTYYLVGEPVKITYTIINNSDNPLRFTFNTSQVYDFSIANYGWGALVYRWSEGKTFAQVITYLEIPAHSSKLFTAEWDQKTNMGIGAAIDRDYRLNFWLIPEEDSFGKIEQSPYLATVIFSIVSTANMPFPDLVDPNVQYFVNFLYEKGLIKGYSDGTFKPEKHLTRTESAVLILRAMGIMPSESYSQDFSDVPVNFWGFKWIEEAFSRGIVKGTGQGKFLPNDEVTRGEFVTILVRAMKFTLVEKENPFVDLEPSYFGYREIITAYYNSIAYGAHINDRINFNPLSVLTRGDAAILMGRAIKVKG
ncbi:MAG: S-layer homology domain-containing protein [Caldisericaceae bacterium]|nr:S-layer homology domain-containing protein [Caldisericaceae bacterium]